MDIDSASLLLNQWNEEKKQYLPKWEIKRASLVAEIGQIDEAKKIAEEALNRIRYCLQSNSIDYSLLSQEGSAIFLLHSIKGIYSELDKEEDDRNRLEKLETYKCNPSLEREKLLSNLSKERPKPSQPKETKQAFDP